MDRCPMFPVYINGRFLTQTPSGMHRFARQLITDWDDMRRENGAWAPAEVLVPSAVADPGWKTLSLRVVPGGKGHVWEQTRLFTAARKGLLVNLLSSGPLLHRRQVASFHDASIHDVPQFYMRRYRLLHYILEKVLSRRARRIITVSRFSRERLEEALGIEPGRISVIPNGCDHMDRVVSDTGILARYGLAPGSYFLCVGSETPNKNIAAAIRAFAHLDRPGLVLVHAGARDARIFSRSETNGMRGLLRLGHVSDGELRALYENALALLFPSRYEGFGIPPLEAMRLGCPVVSSRGGALPEVLGEAALFIDPDDVPAFADALRRIADEPVLRDRLAVAGRAHAARYTWRAAAEAFDALVRDLVSPALSVVQRVGR